MDETIVAKIPIGGQVNTGVPVPPIVTPIINVESDLVEGDLIYVHMFVPRANTVDIYYDDQSLRIMGIGEAPF